MRCWLRGLMLMALLLPLVALGQTRAWLDRDQISMGETVALNIATDQPVTQIDTTPLRTSFDLGGQSVRRSFEWVNGRMRRQTVFALGLRPRGPGVWDVPALQVGADRTAPLRLVVRPPTVEPAQPESDLFVDMATDTRRPYVQQTVGVTVRVHHAIPLLSGQLDLDAPPGMTLQRLGEDLTYDRMLGGRRYHVIERRYLLIPERSGSLLLPGARLNALRPDRASGWLGDFDTAPVSAAAPAILLDVQPIPATAPQPWLPLHALHLRYLHTPTQAVTGTAVNVDVEAQADGATAAQMPALEWPASPAVQVFAEPPQVEERFLDGRPQTFVRRRFALVPQQPGMVVLSGPRLPWWNAERGRAEVAALPPLRLQVAAGQAGPVTQPATPPMAPATLPSPANKALAPASPDKHVGDDWRWLPWVGLGLCLVLVTLDAYRRRLARSPAPTSVVVDRGPTLAQALDQGDLEAIARALRTAAGVADLEAVCARLAQPEQVQAVQMLQAARWGNGEPAAALAALRRAFAGGPRWQTRAQGVDPLPPLYPD